MKRISSLKESPCYKCSATAKCLEKVERVPRLMEICNKVAGDASFNYHNCGIYISFTAPEMIDES